MSASETVWHLNSGLVDFWISLTFCRRVCASLVFKHMFGYLSSVHSMHSYVSTYTICMHVLVGKIKEKDKTVFVCVCVRVCAFNVVVAKMPPSS